MEYYFALSVIITGLFGGCGLKLLRSDANLVQTLGEVFNALGEYLVTFAHDGIHKATGTVAKQPISARYQRSHWNSPSLFR